MGKSKPAFQQRQEFLIGLGWLLLSSITRSYTAIPLDHPKLVPR